MLTSGKLTRRQRKALHVQDRREDAIKHMQNRIRVLKAQIVAARGTTQQLRKAVASVEFLTGVCAKTKSNLARSRRKLTPENFGVPSAVPAVAPVSPDLAQEEVFQEYTLTNV